MPVTTSQSTQPKAPAFPYPPRKTIVAIKHVKDRGKTTTLRELARLLCTAHPDNYYVANSITLPIPNPPPSFQKSAPINPTGDFSLLIEINGKWVAVVSLGDPNTNTPMPNASTANVASGNQENTVDVDEDTEGAEDDKEETGAYLKKMLEEFATGTPQDVPLQPLCELIFCARRTRGGTQRAIEDFAGNNLFDLIWVSTYEFVDPATLKKPKPKPLPLAPPQVEADRNYLNKWQAEHLRALGVLLGFKL